MNKKTLLITLCAASIVSAVGVYIATSQQGQVDMDSPRVLPELFSNAGSLDHIKIESGGNTLLVESHKEGDKWVIDNLGNYDADTAKLSSLIKALKNARKVEEKTAKPANFHHLGLRDVSEEHSKAVLVSVSGAGKDYKLLVGNSAKAGTGQYVRLNGQNQTWLINLAIDKPEKAEDWVNTKLFDFTVDDIQSVSLSGKYQYDLSKADKEKTNFTLDSVPATHKLKYDSIVDAVPRNLSGLKFEQLQAVADFKATEATDKQTIAVKLFAADGDGDGEIGVTVSKIEEQYYAQLTGSNPLWQQWVYQISEYSYNQLAKDKMDYLDVIEAPKADVVTPSAQLP
jgi:hypothetical protein